MKSLISLLVFPLLLLLSTTATSELPDGQITLIKDINPGVADGTNGLFGEVDPYFKSRNSYLWGDVLYFGAKDPEHGDELWRSDGTESGTYMVRDIVPGLDGSFPTWFASAGDYLVFKARNAVTLEYELWRTDGTETGTQRVADNLPVAISYGGIDAILEMGGLAYFRSPDENAVDFLWVTDGTTEGTRSVAKVPQLFLAPIRSAVKDGVLYFTAKRGSNIGLWRTDGTETGTFQLRHSKQTHYLCVFNDKVFFTGYTPQLGYELWSTDGTVEGTRLFLDIRSGMSSGHPAFMRVVDGHLFFTASTAETGQELWRSDGTVAGTAMVKDIRPGPAWGALLRDSAVIGNQLYFQGNDGAHGIELWTTDGTTEGTRMVVDVQIGMNYRWYMYPWNGHVYFTADDGPTGHELWVSDGETAGLVMDLFPGMADGRPIPFTSTDETLFIEGRTIETGFELYRISALDNACTSFSGLITSVESMALRRPNTRSLLAKLENGQAACERGNTKAACNLLGAFGNEMSAIVATKSGLPPIVFEVQQQAGTLFDRMCADL